MAVMRSIKLSSGEGAGTEGHGLQSVIGETGI
ncbi:hypothetical protein Tco_0709468, partial [Tanacetum coccineum]